MRLMMYDVICGLHVFGGMTSPSLIEDAFVS